MQNKQLTNSILILVGAVFVLAFYLQSHKLFQLDNMDFPAVALAASKMWLPIYYRGELLQEHSGLYHPPLFIYLLAGWIRIFDFSETSVRFFVFSCGLISFVVWFKIIGWFCSENSLAKTVFVTSVCSSFYFLQVLSIVDIDNSVLLLGFSLLFCIVYLYIEGRVSDFAFFVTGCFIFTLLLLSKLTTPLLAPVITSFVFIQRFGWMRGALISIGFVFVSLILFIIIYGTYSLISGLDITYTFKFLLYSLTSKTGGASSLIFYWERIKTNLVDLNLWLVFPFFAAGLGCAITLFLSERSEKKRLFIILIVFFAFSVVFIYSLITSPFGGAPNKYVAVSFLPLCFLVSAYFGSLSVKPNRILFLGCMCCIIGVVLGARWPDWLLDRNSPLSDLLILRFFIISGIIFAVTAFSCIISVPAFQKGLLTITAALLYLVQGISFAMIVKQVSADYATQYDYGQVGLLEVVNFVKNNTKYEDKIVSMKDVGFYSNRRYFENYGNVYSGDLLATQSLWSNPSIKYLVFTEGRGQDQLIVNPPLKSYVESNFLVRFRAGNYVVYERR